MVQYIESKTLKESFESFDPQTSLNEQFEELAKYFLYGGYIHVKSENIDRRIFIKEVEFYFYDETGKIESNNKVYHRNGKYSNIPDNDVLPIGRNTHYFKPGSLYLHASGVDITFENKKNKFRASALIRAFSVEEKGHLQPIYIKRNQNVIVDPRSTYIYEYMFEGLSIFGGNKYSINWIDEWKEAPKQITKKERINIGDEKKWRFIWT
jgi:hypothetical protein